MNHIFKEKEIYYCGFYKNILRKKILAKVEEAMLSIYLCEKILLCWAELMVMVLVCTTLRKH